MGDNSTTLSNGFTEDYAIFNYIMVAASCGLLLIVIIVAKVLCMCNKDHDYDKVNFDLGRNLSDEFIVPKESLNYSSGLVEKQHIPGEVYQEQLNNGFDMKSKSMQEEFYKEDDQHRHGVWHTPNMDNDSDLQRLDTSPWATPVSNVSPDISVFAPSLSRNGSPPLPSSPSSAPTTEGADGDTVHGNVDEFLRQLETFVDIDADDIEIPKAMIEIPKAMIQIPGQG